MAGPLSASSSTDTRPKPSKRRAVGAREILASCPMPVAGGFPWPGHGAGVEGGCERERRHVVSDPDKIRPLWVELRAAAGTMSLWGQVAAAEMAQGEISKRILAACERLITVIEQLEGATGWSDEDSGLCDVEQGSEELGDGPH